jgi:hypothetical protein
MSDMDGRKADMTTEQIAMWLALEGYSPWQAKYSVYIWGVRKEDRYTCYDAEDRKVYQAECMSVIDDELPRSWGDFPEQALYKIYEAITHG